MKNGKIDISGLELDFGPSSDPTQDYEEEVADAVTHIHGGNQETSLNMSIELSNESTEFPAEVESIHEHPAYPEAEESVLNAESTAPSAGHEQESKPEQQEQQKKKRGSPFHLRMGDRLLFAGVITPAQLQRIEEEQKRSGNRFGDIVVSLSFASREIVEAEASRSIAKANNLGSMFIPDEVIRSVPVELARKHVLVPIHVAGNSIYVAIADPFNLTALDEIRTATDGKVVIPLEADVEEIRKVINTNYEGARKLQKMMAASEAKAEGGEPEADAVKVLEGIMEEAVHTGCTDVHIEPFENFFRVRFRQSGMMEHVATMEKALLEKLVARVKIKSELDITERRLPQDGRFTHFVDGARFDVRVATCGAIHGETVVLRLLSRDSSMVSLSGLGMSSNIEVAMRELANAPHGIVLVSGPTGSGKSTTMCATLYGTDRKSRSVFTIEDPVEAEIEDVIQIHARENIGLGFDTVFRSLLRQDPDVVMVGEMRDTETANLAFRAAMTGHLVISSIHANDAPSTIHRLIDMGVDQQLVPLALRAVLAQRLVRRLCPKCKEEIPASLVEQAVEKHNLPTNRPWTLYRPVGCPSCHNRGYAGRTGIHELWQNESDSIHALIANKAPAHELREGCMLDDSSIFLDGAMKAGQGITTIEEVLRVTENG